MKTEVTVLSVSQWRPSAYDYYDVRPRIPNRTVNNGSIEIGRNYFKQSFIQIRCRRQMRSPFEIVLTSNEYEEIGRPTVGDTIVLEMKKQKAKSIKD